MSFVCQTRLPLGTVIPKRNLVSEGISYRLNLNSQAMQLTSIRLVKQQQCSFIPKYTYIVMGEVLKMKVTVTKMMTCSWLAT